MNLLDDPSMKEIVLSFCDESKALITQLEQSLEILEDNPMNHKEMENFGQIIDRIMGAAKSIGAMEIATFCELGKVIGYKASQINDAPLLNVVVAVLFDSIDLLTKMIDKLKTGNNNQLQGLNTAAFAERLKWLSEKFKDIKRASVAYDAKTQNSVDVSATNKEEEEKVLNQNEIEDLVASLGL